MQPFWCKRHALTNEATLPRQSLIFLSCNILWNVKEKQFSLHTINEKHSPCLLYSQYSTKCYYNSDTRMWIFHTLKYSVTPVWGGPMNSTQFWHCLPGDNIRLRAQFQKNCPLPPHQSPITSPNCHLCFWLTGYNSGFLWPPPWVRLIC